MNDSEKQEIKKIRESIDLLHRKLDESDAKVAELKKKLLVT